MSPNKRIESIVTNIPALAAAIIIVTVFALGFAGWPLASANAASVDSELALGLNAAQATQLSEEVTATDKFVGSDLTTQTTLQNAMAAAAAVASITVLPGVELPVPVLKVDAAPKRTAKPDVRHWSAARVSWYGPGFYGHGMAGGGKLRRDSMIVAHRHMKFGTKLRIYYKGRVVTAVVKDRGPYVHGRTFDLGPGVAKRLKFSGVGTIRYKVVHK